MTEASSKEQSTLVTITLKDFEQVDLEAPIRDSRNVDCESLSDFYKAAGKKHAESGNHVSASVYELMFQVTWMYIRSDNFAEPFVAIFGSSKGSRSITASDLKGEQSAVFATIVGDIGNPGLRARLADIVWLNDTELHDMAQLAIGAYCEAVQAVLDAKSVFCDEHELASGSEGREMLARACWIAKATGWKDPEGSRLKMLVSDVIQNAIDQQDSFGFYDLAKIGLQFGIVWLSELARRAKTMAAKDGMDPYLSHDLWELAAQAYTQSRNEHQRDRCLISAAECFVSLADASGNKGMDAVNHLESAIEDLRRVPGTERRQRQLKRLLSDAQSSIGDQTDIASTEIDQSTERKSARVAVSGLSLSEALAEFAELEISPDPDKLWKDAWKLADEYPLPTSVQRDMVDRDGKTVWWFPACDMNEKNDDRALRHLIAEQEHYRRQWLVHGTIDPTRHQIHHEHRLEHRDFFALVAMSPFVPDDMLELFSWAFARFFSGDFTSALHILVPQLENSLRHALKLAGHDPSSINSDTTEENRDLSVMLQQERGSLEDIYGLAIVFEIETLFDFRPGPALRHQVAHGLLSADACKGADAIYACWFVFHLCCLPVAERWDELAELMERE